MNRDANKRMNKDIQKIINKQWGKSRDKLIPVLQEVQSHFGFLPRDAMYEVGRQMNIPTSKIHGVITFYRQFRYTPRGKYHIRLCRGTSCHLKKSANLLSWLENHLGIHQGNTDKGGLFSLETVPCMGICGEGPVIAVNEEYYTQTDQKKLQQIMDIYQNLEKDT